MIKKKYLQNMLMGIFLLGSSSFSSLFACTGIKLQAKDNSIVHGRTLEYAVDVSFSAAVIPRGYDFTGTTPNGPGLKYKSKYASVGMICFGVPSIMDGINEKGLGVGVFYFPGYASYTPTNSENQKRSVSPVEFSNWIITQFATIDEVKKALPDIVIAPMISKDWGSTPPPFHYIVYDANGKSMVIEPLNGQLITYDNTLGVITNSPTFDWHTTNLRNYINLRALNTTSVTVDDMLLAPFSQGSGMVGIPGDFTSPSRFVRASIFSATAVPVENAHDAVYQVFHILNQFDIPLGVVREKDPNGQLHMDYTLATCVKDPQALRYYFKTYQDQSVKMVDLKSFDFNAKKIKTVDTAEVNHTALNISSELKNTM